MNRDAFIEEIGIAAVSVMVETGFLASVTIAQAVLESWDAGKGKPSGLAEKGKNLFGIKGAGTDGSIRMKTREVIGGKSVLVDADFRKYHSWDESIADRTQLLLNARRGDGTLRYAHIAGVADPEQAARLLQKAGYATDAPKEIDGDPSYAEKLVALIRSENLTRFDELARKAKQVPAGFEAARAFVLANRISDGERPNDPVTRAEVWEMLRRFCEAGKAGDGQ